MFQQVKRLLSTAGRDAQLQQQLERLRDRLPIPVLWLLGKTQSGKTSIIKYLTGADAAEIGHGFRPCTPHSREYQFPTPEAPLLTLLDTRGLDDPAYDPAEDLARFNAAAHVVILTVKAMDHAQENVLKSLESIRRARRARPVLLALTCLHEAYPQEQHPMPDPFHGPEWDHDPAISEPLRRSLEAQRRRFQGLVDHVVPIDLTRPEEGFAEPNYGGERLKATLLAALPSAYRQSLLTLEEATQTLQDLYARHALPHILGYSTLAASAGAIPVPWLDLLILPAIQSRMIYHLAQLYGQPLSAARFAELAGTLGLGMLVRQGVRELIKLVPFAGSVAGSVLAGASTFALGKAFCYYYSAVHQGHVPRAEDLRRYYNEELARASRIWSNSEKPSS